MKRTEAIKCWFVPYSLHDPLRNAWIRMKEYASSSVSLFQSTRGGTIILSHALWLLLFSCYHDQNHTHYVVEVIEVVVGGGTPPMRWQRRRRWPMPPTCSRYSVCRHYRPRSHHSGLAVYHPVVCCRRPGKIVFDGKSFLRDEAEKWNKY